MAVERMKAPRMFKEMQSYRELHKTTAVAALTRLVETISALSRRQLKKNRNDRNQIRNIPILQHA